MKKFFVDLIHRRRLQKIIILLTLGLAVYLILPQLTTLEKSWNVVLSLALWAVGLAFIAQIVSVMGNGFLVQQALATAGQVASLIRSTLIILGSISIGMVAGGFVGSSAAIYGWTSGGKGSVEGATLASILPAVFNTLMLVILSIFGLTHLIMVHNLARNQLIGFSAALVILGIVAGAVFLLVRFRAEATRALIWIAGRMARLRRKQHDPTPTLQGIDRLFDAWDTLIKGRWQLLALGSLLNVSFDMLTLYFMFVAAGNPISLGVLLSGYGLPLLLGRMAFILPGGVGVVESTMAALYAGLGISNATAVVVVLGYRLISFWIPSLSGFLAATYLQSTLIRS